MGAPASSAGSGTGAEPAAVSGVLSDRWLVVALALLSGSAAGVHPLPVACSFGAVLVLSFQRLSFKLWLLVTLALFGAAFRATLALSAYETERTVVRDALGAPARCSGVGRVIASPTVGEGVVRFLAELEELDCEGRPVPKALARLYGGPRALGRGDRFNFVGQLGAVRHFRNLDAPDPRPFAARKGALLSGSLLSLEVTAPASGALAVIDRARARVRERIEQTFSPAVVGLARALVLGENDLDAEDDEAFRHSGLAHLLAVSGTHLVFAVVMIVRALTALLTRIEMLSARFDVGRLAAAMGGVLALFYADFAGGSGSAWRAAWMLGFAFGARALGRHASGARALAASLLIGVLADPLAAFDISFLLSAAATFGLIALGRPCARRCERIRFRPLRWLALSVIATLSSMLPCTPLLSLLSPELTLAGIAANVVAAPFGELAALPLCLLHTLLAPLPNLESGVALSASGALLVVKKIAHLSADARMFAFGVPSPSEWQLAVLAVGCLLLGNRGLVRNTAAWLAALALVLLEILQIRAGHPRGVLRFTALDVGQGDSALVDLPGGELLLLDAGGFVGSPIDPGKSAVLPVLRARRRTRIDLMVLSHPHPDHFGGLSSVLKAVEVGELWDTGQGEVEGAGPQYAALLAEARARGVRIRRPPELCGEHRSAGLVLRVLAPCPAFVPGRDENDNSFVLHLAFGERALLLTGDAEAEQERELAERHGASLRADWLKVGHHGSRTSTSEAFLKLVDPELATISCGVRNRFGHPHPIPLETLSKTGVHAFRTDRMGSVELATDGAAVTVRAFSHPR